MTEKQTQNFSQVDFEDLIEQQDEAEMPAHVIWLELEQKHLDKISRVWTWICIFIQLTVFLLIIYTYSFIALYVFADETKLTPLFYKTQTEGFLFYGIFLESFDSAESACAKHIDQSDEAVASCICSTM